MSQILVCLLLLGVSTCEGCSTKMERKVTPCPPPPGESPPPGCSLTFIQDLGGQIDCQEDEDCPYRLGGLSRTFFLISRSVWIGGILQPENLRIRSVELSDTDSNTTNVVEMKGINTFYGLF